MSGLNVLILDTEARTNNHYLALAIADAFRRHPRIGTVTLADYGDAIPGAQAGRPDLFLAFGGAGRQPNLLARLCALSGTSVLWTTEDPYEVAGNADASQPFDIVFTNDGGSVHRYGGRARHLPLAASRLFQDFAPPTDERRYRYDVLFVGTAWPNRVDAINDLLREAAGIKVKVALPGNPYLPEPRLVRPDLLIDWRCGNTDFARLANRSRVVLTLPRVFSGRSATDAAGTTPPPRLFENALAGTCQVVASPEAETTRYYADGSEIALNRDPAALVGEIRALLADPGRRLALATRARARTLAEHLYDHRVATILDAVGWTARPGPTGGHEGEERPRVLFLTHNRAGGRPGGGIELYQETVIESLTAFEPVIAYPSRAADGSWRLEVSGAGREASFPIPNMHHRLHDPVVETVFGRVLREWRIDLLHVHHQLHQPLSLPLIAKAMGVPVVMQLHDYYLVCERFTLLGPHHRFCDVVARGSAQCDACLRFNEGLPLGSKARRDGFTARIAAAADAFVASTPFSANYVRDFFPETRDARIALIEMIDGGFEGPSEANAIASGDGLRVAVTGNVVGHKGAATLLELIEIARGQGYRFEILGYADDGVAGAIARMADPAVVLRGGYTPDELPDLLAGADVTLHLSLWPETYLIALTEAWRAGAIPIVTDLGAPGERVTDGVDGLKVPPADAAAVLGALRRLRYEPGLIASMRDTIALKRFPTVGGHVAKLEDLYRDLVAAHPVPHPPAVNGTFTDDVVTAFDIGIRVNSPVWTSGSNEWDRSDDLPVQRRSLLADALPARHADRPVRVLPPHDPKLLWRITDEWVDGRRRLARSGSPTAADEICIRGWAWYEAASAPDAVVLRLCGPGGVVRYADVSFESRAEIRSLRPDLLPTAAFAARFGTDELVAGEWRVDVLHLHSDENRIAEDVFSFRSAGRLGRTPFTSPRAIRSMRREEPRTAVTLVGHTFSVVAGRLIGPSDGVVRLRLSPGPDDRAGATGIALIDSTGGGFEWDATPMADERLGAVIGAEGRMPPTASGPYRIGAIVVRENEKIFLPSDATVFATGTDGLFVIDDAPAVTGWSLGARSRRDAPHLDGVSVGSDGYVTVTGWLRPRENDLPKGYLAAWTENGTKRWFFAEPQRRQDVASHLSNSSALRSGFELIIPEHVARTAAVRFWQIVGNRRVPLRSFPEAIARLVGPAETSGE